MKDYINKVGVEIEGSWRRILIDQALVKDQSVRAEVGFRHVGEAVSRPLSREELEAWITRNKPDAVNETCGYHVHVSLKKKSDYVRLTSTRFYKLLLKNIREWGLVHNIPGTHHFWRRLEGTFAFATPAGNIRNFCRAEFIPEKQIDNLAKGGNETPRHCHLNYCYKLHGTVELRLFPSWETVELFISSMNLFYNTVNEFLSMEDAKKKQAEWRMKIRTAKKPEVKRFGYPSELPPPIRLDADANAKKKKALKDAAFAEYWRNIARQDVARMAAPTPAVRARATAQNVVVPTEFPAYIIQPPERTR